MCSLLAHVLQIVLDGVGYLSLPTLLRSMHWKFELPRIISAISLKASRLTSSAVVVVTLSSAILVSFILVCLSVGIVAPVVSSTSVARVLSTLHALMRLLC